MTSLPSSGDCLEEEHLDESLFRSKADADADLPPFEVRFTSLKWWLMADVGVNIMEPIRQARSEACL
jgi:hypothetical protein